MTAPQQPENALVQAVTQSVQFLTTHQIPHFLLGGLAIAVVGEPRFTYDVDLDIFVSRQMAGKILRKLATAGFRLDLKQATTDVAQFGSFRMFYQAVPIDCILASTALEQSALKRAKKKKIFPGCLAYVPSPEDLILLKIIPGRAKDLMDAESVVARHGKRLDRKYLEQWAKKICDDAEDFRIWHSLQKLLQSAHAP